MLECYVGLLQPRSLGVEIFSTTEMYTCAAVGDLL